MSDSRSDLADQLGKLASLRDSGALTQDEFETAKARVLGTPPAEPGPGAAQHAAPTPPVYAGQLPPEDLVWNCTNCGKVSGAVRRQCAYCNEDRGSAEARPWQTMDGWVGGVPKSMPKSPPSFQLPYKPRPLPSTRGVPTQVVPPRAPERWNGLTIASFILGLVPVIPFGGSIAAIVFGAIGMSQADARGERGRGLAGWGIFLGVLTIIGWVIIIAVITSNGSS
jgi:hypothetical protein